MPATEQLACTTLPHGKTGTVRKLESELELLHTDQRKTAKQRWSTCFAFIFKRSKFKSTDHFLPSSFYPSSTSSSASTTSSYSSHSSSSCTTAISTNLHTCNSNHRRHNENDNDNTSYDNGKSQSENPTYQPTASLPPTPVSSLSPPPRNHIMTRQSKTKSLTPLDYTFSTCASTPILSIQTPVSTPIQRRHYIPRPSVLRLSLDVDQRYSYTSSIYSSDSYAADPVEGSDNDSQSPPEITTTTTSLLERRRQRQQKRFSWVEDSKAQQWDSYHFKQQQQGDDEDDDDDVYLTSYCQISKDKAHYDAVVASTIHHRLASSSNKEKNGIDQSTLLSLDPIAKVDSLLDTPPSSAPLSSPHHLIRID
ncbi:hypothetical protein BC941DRAFT_435159 [Chlamydoabsidia padenii]|nr:hypothetical protein BC941DRAFT_435159 [Chlamydoabsidia padenii]